MARSHQQIKNDPRWKAARLRVLERDGHACTACGSESDLTVDHIIALSKLLASGGDPCDEDNLTTLCRSCNGRKGDRDATIRVPFADPAWFK